MTAEQQLERSVLERKEREELRAIAQAMSLDTNSRSKKADIIDQILRAAGVEVSEASANGGHPPRPPGPGRRPACRVDGDAEVVELDEDATNGSGRASTNGNSTSARPDLSPTSSGGSQVTPCPVGDAGESGDTDGTPPDRTTPATERDDASPSADRAPRDTRPAGGSSRTRTASTCSRAGAAPTNRATAGVVVAGAAADAGVGGGGEARAPGRWAGSPVLR